MKKSEIKLVIILIFLILLFMLFFIFYTLKETLDAEEKNNIYIESNEEEIEEVIEGSDEDKIKKIIEKYGFPNVVKEGYPRFYDENFLTAFVTKYASDGYIYDWENYKIPTRIVPLAQSELIKDRKEVMLYYTRGWEVLLEMMQLGMILGNIVIIIGASRISLEGFAFDVYEMTDSTFTTEKGKKEDIIAKVLAILTMTNGAVV